jgi:enoyl-CoA hydratase/carnithine racemase
METLFRHEFMRLEKEGKLAWVTFTRERYLNAMSNDCTVQINEIAEMLNKDEQVRVVIIRGEGSAFSTGIDLKELAADRIEMVYHQRWERALRLFETMEKLVIVGMHGYCLGGALQLALAADIRVSTANCQIGLPAIKESLIPGLGTLRLPRYIGWGRAKKMILGGQNIDGQEALRIGLVDHIPELSF